MGKIQKLVISIMILLLPLVGCSSNDPLLEGVYNSEGFYAIDGGHLIREGTTGGGFIHEYNLDAINLISGGSGATFIAPNASSLGGYQLNGITEYLFFSTRVEDDWDEINDGIVEIWFEVNDDNTGGLDTDTVKIQLECWHKIEGELACSFLSCFSFFIRHRFKY